MANITVDTGDELVVGTAGDDTTTFVASVTATDSATLGPLGVAGNGGDGGGGSDSAILTNTTTDTLVNLAGGGISYDALTDSWLLGGVAPGAGIGQLMNGFTSVTFSDDVTLEGGVASSGVTAPTPATSLAGDGSYSADPVTGTNAFDWDGSALTLTSLAMATIVSVDGTPAGPGSSFTNDEGAFSVVSATDVQFTPNTSLLAGLYDVDELVTFTYDVVVDLGGVEYTLSQSFVVSVDFTAGNDTWTAENDTTGLADGDVTEPEAGVDGGNDHFTGDDRANTITANLGDDTLLGKNGDDVLTDSAGVNQMRGGNGNDTVDASGATDGADLGGGAGIDAIMGGSGDDTIYGGNGDDNARPLAGGGNNPGGISGGAGNDIINGGAGGDDLAGDAGNDSLYGGDGDDSLDGGADDDILKAGDGDDTVVGGSGDDLIYTSLGDDTLTGGADEDTFILKPGTGTTTITDFDQAGDDKLDVDALGLTSLAEVKEIAYETVNAGVSEVVIVIDDDTSVVLQNTTMVSLTGSDFDFA